MKKLIALTVTLVILMSTLGAAHAAQVPDSFIPSEFCELYNNALQYILNTRYEEDIEKEELDAIIDALSLDYTEWSNDIVYYNNQDWLLEMSGDYEGLTPDSARRANTITFSVGDDLSPTIRYEIELALALTLCYFDGALNFNTVVDFLSDHSSEGGRTIQATGYQIATFHVDGRAYYCLAE